MFNFKNFSIQCSTPINFFFKNFFINNEIFIFFFIIIFYLLILIFVAFFTLFERKFMALLQRREGPDKVGFEGILQPISDGVKLIKKEFIKPKDNMNSFIFNLSPMISFSASLVLWGLIPLNSFGALSNTELSFLIFLGISSFGAYGVIYSGWVSNNKYALMGALRSIAQIISYEIVFSLLFLPIISLTGSFNFNTIIEFQNQNGWFIWYFYPLAFIFFVVSLAETNRTPFDLPEAEAELVSGYNVEYSSLIFALFFLAEYSSMGAISALFVIFYLGGWSTNSFGKTCDSALFFKKEYNFNFSIKDFFEQIQILKNPFFESFISSFKIVFICMLFIFVRAALPRKRFDQLIQLCWKYFFMVTLSLVIFYIAIFTFVVCNFE